MRPYHGKAYVGLLIGLAVTVIVIIVGQLTWPNHLELKLYDFRHTHFPIARKHPDIVTIVIDDASLEQLERWPWPRRYIGHLVDLCSGAGAELIALDIFMPEEQNKEIKRTGITDVSAFEPSAEFVGPADREIIDNDAEFAAAIARAGNVIVPFYAKLYGDDDRSKSAISGFDPQDALNRQITDILCSDRSVEFEQVFAALRPGRDIHNRDADYYRLLRAYKKCRSLRMIETFGLPFEKAKVNVPIVSFAELTAPIPNIAEPLANSAFISVKEDPDGAVRRIFPLARYGETIYKQFAFACACDVLGISDDRIDLSRPGTITVTGTDGTVDIPLDASGAMLTSWSGRWRGDPSYISVTVVAQVWDFESALQNNTRQLAMIDDLTYQLSTLPDDLDSLSDPERQLVDQKRHQLELLPDAELLREANLQLRSDIERAKADLHRRLNGKIVLVGSFATGAPDFVVTPFSKVTPGIVVHRNVLNTILQGSFINRPARYIEWLAILILGLLMTAISALFRPLISGLALLGLVSLAVLINFFVIFSMAHYWFVLVSPLAAIIFSFMAVTFYRQVTEGRAKRRITARFKQYTSPAVVDRIVNSAGSVSLAGEIRRLSCFFSDLAGFTTTSERLGPQQTVSVLNVYLDRMTEVLDRYSATINKFEGDGIFAFFGAPVLLPDHARLACLAAIDSQRELTMLVAEQQRQSPDFPPLSMRIGISTGEAVVGDCGSHRRFDYTAIGDTVNLAARLEGANKYFGTSVMICEQAFESVKAELAGRYLGKVRVLGKKIGINIYELLCPLEKLTDDQARYNDLFEGGVVCFQDSQFAKAVTNFKECLEIRHDKAASLYLDTSGQFVAEGAPTDFSGCIELTGK